MVIRKRGLVAGEDVPLTTSSVARRLSVAEGTVRAWVRGGRLQPLAITESGIRLFASGAVDRFAREWAAAKRGDTPAR
jgi:predicted site-specific integrase-resolvase